MERPSGETKRAARHGYDGARKQTARRADRPPTARRHPHHGRREERPEASKHMETRQAARNQDEERKHAAVAPQPPTPRPSCRKTGRDAGTDPTDGMINEERDETSRQASRTSQHVPHDEMRISPLLTAAEPTKQADRRNTAEETA